MHYCPYCEKDVTSTIRCTEETYPVLGEDTTIVATVRYCDDCGKSIWDDDLDSQNLKDAFNAYRKKHGIKPDQPLRR